MRRQRAIGVLGRLLIIGAALVALTACAAGAGGCGARRDAADAERDAKAAFIRVDDVLEPPAYGAVLTGDDEEEDGAVLNEILKGLASGAAGEAGSDVYGNILDELGWGKAGGGDTGELKAMNAKLDAIAQEVAEISSQLSSLSKQVSVVDKDILKNVNDPTDAMTEIRTFTTALRQKSQGQDPGSMPAADVMEFANDIEGGLRIRTDVQRIHDAIIPSDPDVKAPVLDNYAALLQDRVEKGLDLDKAYIALETYFVNLVYSQTEGASLVVEALSAKARNAGETSSKEAVNYYDDFAVGSSSSPCMLAAEIDNFMMNTWQLVLANVDPSDPGLSSLPVEAPAIMARAQFLRAQILRQDHFGLRADLVVTQDKAGAITGATATGADGVPHKASAAVATYPDGAHADSTFAAYEWWKGSTVNSSRSYQVASLDFGLLRAGTYKVVAGDGTSMGTATVSAYTSDYVADPKGTIAYGYALASTRTVNGFAAGAATSWKHTGSANVDDQAVTAKGQMEIDANTYSVTANGGSYSGSAEMDIDFTYGGSTAAAVTIHCPATVVGYIGGGANQHSDSSATVSGTVVAWDVTADCAADSKNASVRWNQQDGSSVSLYQDSVAWSVPNGKLSFTAQPGHSYEVRFGLSIKGGNSWSDLSLSDATGMQLSF